MTSRAPARQPRGRWLPRTRVSDHNELSSHPAAQHASAYIISPPLASASLLHFLTYLPPLSPCSLLALYFLLNDRNDSHDCTQWLTSIATSAAGIPVRHQTSSQVMLYGILTSALLFAVIFGLIIFFSIIEVSALDP